MPPQQGIDFNGAYLSLPGAYYADNVQATLQVGGQPTPPLLMVGYTYGLKPFTPQTFTTAQDAINAVRGGPLGAFLPFVANPSPSLNGCNYITIIDCSQNTQSQLALLASGALGAYATLTSTRYGPPSNLLQASVAAGSTAGLKVVLTDNSQSPPVSVTGDNLSAPFQLGYAGTATGGISYTATSGTFIVTSPNSGESHTFSLGPATIPTISVLVEALNGTGFYDAAILSATNGQLPSTELTPMSGVLAPVSGGVVQYSNVRAYLNDIPFWVNQFASTYATAVSGSSALDQAAWLPVAIPPTYFSGAQGVPPTTSNYASGLNVGLTTPAWAVFCDTNSAAVMALLAAHCETASSTLYGKYRRGFTGSSIGDSVAVTMQNAIGLNSLSMNYLYPGIVVTSTSTGLPTLYGGLYAAAAAAGIACGNPIATPLTNKPLNGTGVEVTLSPSQLTDLENAGVMPVTVQANTGLPVILTDTTTWQVDDNDSNTSSQQVACRYWLGYTMISAMLPYVGTIAADVTEATIYQAAVAALNASIYTTGTGNGVLNSWDTSSLKLVYTGTNQVAAISFNATLVNQNKYITIYVPIQPLNITISGSAAAAA